MNDARIGHVVGGRYRLEGVEDAAATSVTFGATHLDLETPVAVRLIYSPTLDPHALQRFRAEARLLQRLRHPNIVEILDFGQIEDGTPFVVAPIVDGQPLAEILAHGALTVEATVKLVVDVARGLRFAHQFNVFHLALTPQNIVVGESAQIMDFLGSRWHEVDATMPLVREYRTASPEVLRGEPATAASDVYALGQLAFACLVGRLPLQDADHRAARAEHLSPRPWALPEELSIPSELAEILLRFMSKETSSRVQNCDEVIDAVERWQASTASTQRLTAIQAMSSFPQVGDVVAGKYVIEAIAGQGGFARVFRARSIETQRLIALKILRPDRKRDTPEARRFEREGKLVFSLLTNPHTISVYGYGETTEGLLYIAFEFIDGETLSALLRTGKFPPQRVVAVLEQCLVSLAEAHGMGVLHRDIKPSNIMLSNRDGVIDWVTVLDFGVAKITSDILAPSELTVAGKSVGTPRYMSPEQIVGDPPGPESDLYSLGLVAYELLTGTPAIRAEGLLDILAEQVDPQSVILPSSANVPVPLALIINRLLRKERSSRYRAASDVLTDLRHLDREAGDRTLDTGTR